MLSRVNRVARDLGVRFNLIAYRRPWEVAAEDWDRDYASGKLDFYGHFRERGRYGVLSAYLAARAAPVRLLDVGCGVGLLRGHLTGIDVAEYVGIDPSSEAIEAARKTQASHESFHVAHLPGQAMGQFDVIVCNEVLYYIEDLPGALSRLHAALKPGGWVLTSIVRHPGDVALQRALAAEFDTIDSVFIRRRLRPRNGWTVGCHAGKATDGTTGKNMAAE